MTKPGQHEAQTLWECLERNTYKLEDVGMLELAPDHNFLAEVLMQLLHIRSLCLSKKPKADTFINDVMDILQDVS